MLKVKFKVHRSFLEGTLFWINSSSRKIYHSGRPFFKKSFEDHDSHLLGTFEELLFKNTKIQKILLKLLEKRERVFGITHGKVKGLEDNLNIVFFKSWDQMYSYGKEHIIGVKQYNNVPIENGFNFNSFLDKYKNSNGIDQNIQNSNAVDTLANEVLILNKSQGNYQKIIENGWKITNLLKSKIKLTFDVKNISSIIVSTHLNHEDISKSIEWIEEMSRCGYQFPDIKYKLMEIKRLQAGYHLENITNNNTLNSIARLYKELKAYSKAEIILLRALELQPNSTYTLTQLGGLYRKLRYHEDGITHYQRSLRIKEDKFALNGLGGLYRDIRDYDNALKCYKNALELNERDMEAHTGIGAVYIDLKEYEQANDHFEKAGTDTVNFLFKEYRMYERENSIESAIGCLKQILNINPSNTRAKSELIKYNYIK